MHERRKALQVDLPGRENTEERKGGCASGNVGERGGTRRREREMVLTFKFVLYLLFQTWIVDVRGGGRCGWLRS